MDTSTKPKARRSRPPLVGPQPPKERKRHQTVRLAEITAEPLDETSQSPDRQATPKGGSVEALVVNLQGTHLDRDEWPKLG